MAAAAVAAATATLKAGKAAEARRSAQPVAPPQFVADPQNKMWPLRIKFMDLIMAGKLAPYGDVAALLGKRLRLEERLHPGGQFQMAVAVLKAWSMVYGMDDPTYSAF